MSPDAFDYGLLKKKSNQFLKVLKKYPHKDISEYTRLIQQLEAFIAFAVWGDDR